MPDTNVLVAAAITPRGLLRPARGSRHRGSLGASGSPQLLPEFESVLTREKFRRWLSEDEARRFVADVAVLADILPDSGVASSRATADPKDEYLVALARAADVVALISGDPHLTELVDMDPPVLTPRPS